MKGRDRLPYDDWISKLNDQLYFDVGSIQQAVATPEDKRDFRNNTNLPPGVVDALAAYFQQHDSDQRAYKRPRNLGEQLKYYLEIGNFEVARQLLVKEIQNNAMHDDKYCHPYQVSEFFGLEQWGSILTEARTKLDLHQVHNGESTQSSSASSRETFNARSPRVIGVRCGQGFGKTHALLMGQRALDASCSLYITYNLDQALEIDQSLPMRAIICRVLLRRLGASNTLCDRLLTHFLDLDLNQLENFACSLFGEETHVFIGIDELTKVAEQAAQKIITRIGSFAQLLESAGVKCTVVATSLDFTSFKTTSDRPTHLISLPSSLEIQQHLIDHLLPNQGIRTKNLVALLSGYHYRSIVRACEIIRSGSMPTAKALTKLNFNPLTPSDKNCLVEHLTSSMNELDATAELRIQHLLDPANNIPPSLVVEAFADDHPIQQFFKMDFFDEATKQLELCGLQYDRVRARLGCKVVPAAIQVVRPNDTDPDDGYFRALKFPTDQVCEDDIFAGLSLQNLTHALYHPSRSNHPFIDRLSVACHETDGPCVVLYQDKINNNLPEAVNGLNTAANAIANSELLIQGRKPNILLVAHVVGASTRTRAQGNLQYPYILVRDNEIEAFYTGTLKPAIELCRLRHTNS
jgi:hypothetical protein